MSWDMVKLGDICSEDKSVTNGKTSALPYLGLDMIESETGNIALQEQLDTITAMPAAVLQQAFSGQI